MAQTVTTRSEVLEQEYEAGTGLLVRAGVLAVLAVILFWAVSVMVRSKPLAGSPVAVLYIPLARVLAAASGLGALASAAIGAQKMAKAKKTKGISVVCPYCDKAMEFMAEPTSDYDCEHCHRRVYFENGAVAPVRDITCTICNATHRVSVKATSYTCESCNRTLRLTDPNDPKKIVVESNDAALRNYDVVLTQVGRNPNEVAMALQSLLVVNMVEARRQMQELPLTVTRNVPERKADAIRRRLSEIGATATVRPTADDGAAARR